MATSCLFWLIVATILVAAIGEVASLTAGTVSGIVEGRRASCRAVGFSPAGVSGSSGSQGEGCPTGTGLVLGFLLLLLFLQVSVGKGYFHHRRVRPLYLCSCSLNYCEVS